MEATGEITQVIKNVKLLIFLGRNKKITVSTRVHEVVSGLAKTFDKIFLLLAKNGKRYIIKTGVRK